jgi:hypothetical protein
MRCAAPMTTYDNYDSKFYRVLFCLCFCVYLLCCSISIDKRLS